MEELMKCMPMHIRLRAMKNTLLQKTGHWHSAETAEENFSLANHHASILQMILKAPNHAIHIICLSLPRICSDLILRLNLLITMKGHFITISCQPSILNMEVLYILLLPGLAITGFIQPQMKQCGAAWEPAWKTMENTISSFTHTREILCI